MALLDLTGKLTPVLAVQYLIEALDHCVHLLAGRGGVLPGDAQGPLSKASGTIRSGLGRLDQDPMAVGGAYGRPFTKAVFGTGFPVFAEARLRHDWARCVQGSVGVTGVC